MIFRRISLERNLKFREGILMSARTFPERLSQAILAGTVLERRFGARAQSRMTTRTRAPGQSPVSPSAPAARSRGRLRSTVGRQLPRLRRIWSDEKADGAFFLLLLLTRTKMVGRECWWSLRTFQEVETIVCFHLMDSILTLKIDDSL